MKKLILSLLLLVGISTAQIKLEKGGNLFWADSLSSTRTTSELEVNGQFDYMNITAIDTGTTYTDSCVVEYAVYRLNQSSTVPPKVAVYDTIWQKVQFMRDSSWTNTNLIPDNASVKSYQVFIGDYDLIRVRMTNVQVVSNRVFKFYAILSRKR